MKTFTKIVALSLITLPLLANAAGKSASASMQVTFEIKESCTVQVSDITATTDKNAKAAPAVACQLKTPFLATRTAAQPAAATSSDSKASATRQDAASGEWTVYF
ncbi:hypothetical protein GTP46_00710 [Duganella sp. FT135W]|uniref:Uncharacterized protein n=1 Tax=Duganella flavida TaxID=2692175 RepID=A0A6L8K4S4_9BURK|nr:hypothetical protein [Duganella flavida]MYM21168.1 hypothetical protein [Duganella flavida]